MGIYSVILYRVWVIKTSKPSSVYPLKSGSGKEELVLAEDLFACIWAPPGSSSWPHSPCVSSGPGAVALATTASRGATAIGAQCLDWAVWQQIKWETLQNEGGNPISPKGKQLTHRGLFFFPFSTHIILHKNGKWMATLLGLFHFVLIFLKNNFIYF